jgi:hypothetical protein
MIDAGLPIAIASDYNPGSSPSGNMNFMTSIACVQYKLTPEEEDKIEKEGPKCFPTKDYLKYRDLTAKLLKIRELNKEETIEETKLLDEMDSYWYNMKDEEKEFIIASNKVKIWLNTRRQKR